MLLLSAVVVVLAGRALTPNQLQNAPNLGVGLDQQAFRAPTKSTHEAKSRDGFNPSRAHRVAKPLSNVPGIMTLDYAIHRRGCRSQACDRRVDVRWAREHRPPMEGALASWFDDAGSTACGTHYALGVANKTLACGTRVRLCYRGCETVVVEDRGPFIAGRLWDLNPGAKAGIGCSDLCSLRWRLE